MARHRSPLHLREAALIGDAQSGHFLNHFEPLTPEIYAWGAWVTCRGLSGYTYGVRFKYSRRLVKLEHIFEFDPQY